jgi:flagellar hook protein FlgE
MYKVLFSVFIMMFLVANLDAQEAKKQEKEVKVEVKVEEVGNKQKVTIKKQEGDEETVEVVMLDDLADLDKIVGEMVEVNIEVDKEKNTIVVQGEEVKKEKKVMRIEKEEEVELDEGVKLELKFKTKEEMTAYDWNKLEALTDGLESNTPVSIYVSVEGEETLNLELKGKVEQMGDLVKRIKNVAAVLGE